MIYLNVPTYLSRFFRMTTWSFLVGLFGLFISSFCLAENISKELAQKLNADILAAAQTQPELMKLIKLAVERGSFKTSLDLTLSVSICEENEVRLAGVNQTSSQKIYFFNRMLDEIDEHGDDLQCRRSGVCSDALKALYLKAFKSDFPKDEDPSGLEWKFENDYFYLLSPMDNRRAICSKKNQDQRDSVLNFAHELVHYTSKNDLAVKDMLQFKNLLDYAYNTVLSSGDEVDAYLLQLKVLIKTYGKTQTPTLGKIKSFFNDQGDFLADRIVMARFVIEDLNYLNNRLRSEFNGRIKAQMVLEKQKLKFFESLQTIRGDQVEEFDGLSGSRYRILNLLDSDYKKDSLRYQALKKKSQESLGRVNGLIEGQKNRIQELEKLAALP